MNVAMVRGRLSSAPRVTEFDSGDVLVRYEVTVPCHDGPSDTVPVAWIGPAKQAQGVDLEAGAELVAVGRVRRRFYRLRSGGQASSTELLASTVVPGSRKAAARRAIAAAWAASDQEPA
jgi:hypothetical protein